jgi:DNA-directed RNA polymerase subunit K
MEYFIYPITKFEKAKVIGTRAQQISQGSKILIKTKKSDPIEIAKKEYQKGLIPLVIERGMPDGTVIKIRMKPKLKTTNKIPSDSSQSSNE